MILLTGASGFIGKHLHIALVNQFGHDNVLALTSEPLQGYKYLLHNDYHFDSYHFIANDYSNLIEIIIHAGAYTPKSASQANNYLKCNQNIYSTEKLLSAHLPKLKKVIYLSTLDVYARTSIISESTIVEPVSLYGWSKVYSEKMVEAWANDQNKICQILRIGHVYGPGEEKYQKIIPVTIKKLIKKQPLQIWGTGTEVRSFIYVDDVVESILNSLQLNDPVGPINLVSSNQISILNLVDKLISLSGQNVNVENIVSDGPPRDLVFDNTKLKKYLLSSEKELSDGLAKEWHYMNQKNE